LGWRQDSGRSETLVERPVSNESGRLFGNLEYRPSGNLSINAGAYVDHDRLSGTSTTPRIGFNWSVTPSDTLRFVSAKGAHKPDLHEQLARWSYTLRGATPLIGGQSTAQYYQSAISPGGESNVRNEVGYFGVYQRNALTVEAVAFTEHLTNLISEKLQVSSFKPTNNGSARLRGIEGQIAYTHKGGLSASIGGAYVENRSTQLYEKTQLSTLSGFANLSYQWSPLITTSLAAYGANARAPGQFSYGRQDVIMKLNHRVSGFVIQTTATLSHLNNTTTSVFRDVGATNYSRINNKNQAWLAIQFSY
jgi:iron complex outermembrane recepter protein